MREISDKPIFITQTAIMVIMPHRPIRLALGGALELLTALSLHFKQARQIRRTGDVVKNFWFPVYLCASFTGVALYDLFGNFQAIKGASSTLGKCVVDTALEIYRQLT